MNQFQHRTSTMYPSVSSGHIWMFHILLSSFSNSLAFCARGKHKCFLFLSVTLRGICRSFCHFQQYLYTTEQRVSGALWETCHQHAWPAHMPFYYPLWVCLLAWGKLGVCGKDIWQLKGAGRDLFFFFFSAWGCRVNCVSCACVLT